MQKTLYNYKRHSQVAGIVCKDLLTMWLRPSPSRLTNKVLANQPDIVVIDKNQKLSNKKYNNTKSRNVRKNAELEVWKMKNR